ncbi:hypothetical protein HDV63DRAFT_373792 [Trichoderma sp. SZMC 28014]
MRRWFAGLGRYFAGSRASVLGVPQAKRKKFVETGHRGFLNGSPPLRLHLPPELWEPFCKAPIGSRCWNSVEYAGTSRAARCASEAGRLQGCCRQIQHYVKSMTCIAVLLSQLLE